MKTFLAALFTLILMASFAFAHADTTPYAQHEELKILNVRTNSATIPRYGKFEITIDLTADYDNPFDPEQIDVSAEFFTPSYHPKQVAGFFNRNYTRRLVNGAETWTADGKPFWTIRFAPDEVGVWKYNIVVKNKHSNTAKQGAEFTVTRSDNPGFIQVSKSNPRMLAYENGRPFFVIGENMGWADGRGVSAYDEWLANLGKSGGNWIRVWMSAWNGALEWSKTATGDWRNGTYEGLGVYSLDNAAKIDAILDAAEKNNITTMLCFGTYGEFTTGGAFNEGMWKSNPYNKANGGPCEKPEDFWKNTEARKLYRRRLRYIAARYGYRTSLHAWEFWNEANPPADWVKEMADYLKGKFSPAEPAADAHHHLVSTSYGSPDIWKLASIDFTMSHDYGMGDKPDHAPVIHSDAASHAVYNKPHLMAEFGIDWRDADAKYDPEGKAVNFHNGLWASAMSGNAGGGILWWWDNYVAPKNLYAQFTPLKRFADTIDWTGSAWKPLAFDAPQQIGVPETLTDLTLTANGSWGKSAQSDFTLTGAELEGSPLLPSFLYSPSKTELRTPTRFHVKLTQPTRFAVNVNTVSDHVVLRVLVDDKPVKDFTLNAAPPKDATVKPDYESTKLVPEYGIYQAHFGKDFSVEIPAGEHIISLDVTEGDWMSVSAYMLANFRSSRFASVTLYGMSNGKEAVLWAQNPAHNWKNVFEKKAVPAVEGVETNLRGLPNGKYKLEWRDTTTGAIVKTEQVTAKSGALKLRLPKLETDIALHIRPAQ